MLAMIVLLVYNEDYYYRRKERTAIVTLETMQNRAMLRQILFGLCTLDLFLLIGINYYRYSFAVCPIYQSQGKTDCCFVILANEPKKNDTWNGDCKSVRHCEKQLGYN